MPQRLDLGIETSPGIGPRTTQLEGASSYIVDTPTATSDNGGYLCTGRGPEPITKRDSAGKAVSPTCAYRRTRLAPALPGS